MILAGTQTGSIGGSQTQCSPVVITPSSGQAEDTVTLITPTSGAHIFFTNTLDTGIDPTHTGDNPTGTTVRIGSNSGSVVAKGNLSHGSVIRALAYKPGFLDSIISEGDYGPAGDPGGGGGG